MYIYIYIIIIRRYFLLILFDNLELYISYYRVLIFLNYNFVLFFTRKKDSRHLRFLFLSHYIIFDSLSRHSLVSSIFPSVL